MTDEKVAYFKYTDLNLLENIDCHALALIHISAIKQVHGKITQTVLIPTI